jgi:DNA-directed RNA polymerase specialized sigma24 family protein
MPNQPHAPPVDARFPTTHWSLVGRAGRRDDDSRREALSEVLRTYLPAVRAYLTRVRRIPPDRADDVLQAFLTRKVIEEGLLARADPARGRFRAFLIRALDNFYANLVRAEGAKGRRPDRLVSLESAHDPPTSEDPPDRAFDVAWARQVLDAAVEGVRAECAASARPDVWGVFEARVLLPALHDVEPVPYADLVARFGFSSPSQASNVLVTANRMFARALRAVVGAYTLAPDEIELEIQDLRQILSGGGAGRGR